MRRAALALVLAALAAAAFRFAPGRSPAPADPLTLVETAAPATPLDAALILRAVLRFEPKGVTFLDPLAGSDGEPLLRSKLGDATVPVRFTTGTLVEAPPAGPALVKRISFDRLMIRTERSESGVILADLDDLFRGRLVAVETAGGTRAAALAGRRGGAVPIPAPPWAGWLGVALAASLPWWRLGRFERLLAAAGVAAAWMLLGTAVERQFSLVMPLFPALALPLLAMIPPGSPASDRRMRSVCD